jgi:hypothetical protein
MSLAKPLTSSAGRAVLWAVSGGASECEVGASTDHRQALLEMGM